MAGPRLRPEAAVAVVFVLLSLTVRGSPPLPQTERDEQVRVKSLIDAGRYADAESEAATLARQSPSSDATDLLVEALVANGRGAQRSTRELATAAVQARRDSQHPPIVLAGSVRHLGEVLFESGDYSQAVSVFREALQLLDTPTGNGTPLFAALLDDLAQALTELVEADTTAFGQGVQFINRSLTLADEIGDAHRRAHALHTRGLLRQRKGDYVSARADLEQAIEIQEGAFPLHPETALFLADLGEQFTLAGNLVGAREVLSRACAMAESTLRASHPIIARCFASRALALEELGMPEDAKALREKALEIAAASLGEDHPRFAVQLNDLANNRVLLGDFASARTLYERARATYARSLGPASNGATVATYNLALVSARLGDYAGARRALDEVVATWTRALGPEHPNVARALSALGEMLAEQGRNDEARTYYTRALRIREKALGPNHPYVARTLSNLAMSLGRLGRMREAVTLSNRALDIWEKTEARAGLAEALMTHGQLLTAVGDFAGAEAVYTKALDIRLALGSATHPTVAETEVALAGVELRLGRPDSAFPHALEGEQIGREHSRLTLGYLSEREALEYIAARPRGLDLALASAHDAADRGAVYNELIRGRALALDELASRRHAASDSSDPDIAALWEKLRSARQRFANLIVRQPDESRADAYSALIDEAGRNKETAERALAERSTTFRATESAAQIGLNEVRQALPEDAALVSFIRYDAPSPTASPNLRLSGRSPLPTMSLYGAFVLRPGGREPVIVVLGSAPQIDRQIAAWRQALLTGATTPATDLPENERALRVVGASLRRRIWDPVASEVSGAKRVFVVPDSTINLIPFAALPAPTGGYLIESGPIIHYLTAERDIAARASDRRDDDRGLLAIGGPSFSDPTSFSALRPDSKRPPRGVEASPRIDSPASRAPVDISSLPPQDARSPCVTLQNMKFDPLPAAAREAAEVATLWHALAPATASIESLVGSGATESAVKARAPLHGVLHVATHGFFLGDPCAPAASGTRAVGGITTAASPAATSGGAPRAGFPENPLIMSGLAFAGANRRAAAASGEDDGILTAEEVASLDLSGVQWAVLSACDTGLGVIKTGEGVFGLRRAFQVAGARTIIMSLWAVEDRGTVEWMRALYTARLERHLNTSDSLQYAAQSVLRTRRARGLTGHPFFWAGFVAAGDWR